MVSKILFREKMKMYALTIFLQSGFHGLEKQVSEKLKIQKSLVLICSIAVFCIRKNSALRS